MVKPPSLADLMIEPCQFDPGFFFYFLDPGNSHRVSSSSKFNFWPWKKCFFKPKSYPFLAMEEKQHFCFFEPKNYPKTLNLEGNPLLLL